MENKIKINKLDSDDISRIIDNFFFTLAGEHPDIDKFKYDELDNPDDIVELVNTCSIDMVERFTKCLNEVLDYCIAREVWEKIRVKLDGCPEFKCNDVYLILSMIDKDDLEKTKELIKKHIKIN